IPQGALLILILSVSRASSFGFQTSTGAPPETRSPSTYRLQVGDEINITDLKAPTKEPLTITVPVTPDGLLHLPFARLGAVPAAGKTIEEVRKAIYEEFKKIYKRPDIVVVPRRIVGGSRVDVLGPVMKPGRYPHYPGMTVMDALSEAAGLREGVSPTQAYIVRGRQSEIIVVDLRKLLAGNPRENKTLEPDDAVLVQEPQPAYITVYGCVEKPGVYGWQEGMKVVQAIAQSEGFKAGAELRDVVVLREGKKIPVNFLLLQEAADSAQNVPLQPGDTVFVPKANRTVVVVGGVREPGAYPFEEGDRVLRAIGLAKGFDENADRSGIVRVRRRGKELTVDLSKTRRDAHADDNVPLEPNDVVIVPVRGEVTVVGEVRRVGTYPMKPDMRLADAIGLAEGLTPQANRSMVKIFRAGQILHADVTRLDAGDAEANVRLEPGDTVLVTSLQGVSVFGAVGQPGTVPLPDDPRIFNVLAAAHGWLTQEAAEEATVLRTQGGKLVPLTVNLKKLQAGDPSQNTLIKPGDIIIVPYKKEPQNWQKAQNIASLLSSVSYLRFLLGR
ncbi:MAG: SLBB domain-containing protein, partial [Abditibacteriales bacterium]|nr:SLBB domain-containing protein [Abditibacteriales bacterium]MDW8366713.1 SLBB domain-containing protein [Abditibacteriales bacterium]